LTGTDRRARLLDWGRLLFCNLVWASQFVLAKVVQERMGPVVATFIPMTLATLLLLPVLWRDRARRGRCARPPGADVIRFAIIGVFGQVSAQLFVTWGVGIAPASNAALLGLTLPAVTALLAFLILGERMTAVRWASFGLALLGVLQCSGIDWSTLELTRGRFLAGNLLIVGGVAGSAFFNVYGKRLLERYTPLEVLVYGYYAVVATLLPMAVALEPGGLRAMPSFGAKAWGGLLLLAVFQYAVSMVVFLDVLSRLGATQAALSNYLIPVFGLVIAWLALGETMTLPMALGGLLVLASTLLVTVYEDRRGTSQKGGQP